MRTYNIPHIYIYICMLTSARCDTVFHIRRYIYVYDIEHFVFAEFFRRSYYIYT